MNPCSLVFESGVCIHIGVTREWKFPDTRVMSGFRLGESTFFLVVMMNGGAAIASHAGTRCGQRPAKWSLLERFFDLTDLFLNFAEVVFGFAFSH
jgi:hypothetical protein